MATTEAVPPNLMRRHLSVVHPSRPAVLVELGFASLLVVAAGLASLADGDASEATEVYEQLVTRWRRVQLLERAN